jgi:predicted acylesterase/phospholipase RssA
VSDQPECDIVMKGGITSGVVYPRAVVELSRTYRFRSIGGTSAGAIAAAVVAAAEHGRRGGGAGGFDVLDRLPDELAATGPDGKPFMLQLFQADPATRGLFGAAMGALGPDRAAGVAAALREAFPPSRGARLAGGAVGGVARLVGRLRPKSTMLRQVAAVAPALGSVGPAVRGAAQALTANDFGLCRLGPDAGSPQRPALTAWLQERIQEAAGRGPADPVLTFADLWGAPALPADPGAVEAIGARRRELRRLSGDAEARAVDLQMMTTDLTHGRPLRLPVCFQPHKDRLEEGGGTLLYDPSELSHFFGPGVMAALARAAACDPLGDDTVAGLAATGCGHLRRFPIGPDLPVIVGTRMSLSFPVLISAVPLYEIVRDRTPGADGAVTGARRVYFSDGGISSNFPVHFFDGPLPRRPTFGLQLTSFGPDEVPTTDAEACVVAPDAPGTPAPPSDARAIEDVPQFFGAIKDAMQNWRDNAQTQLPGFRDRIVRIKLGPKEGGLNLNMTGAQIESLTGRGALAGRRLAELFAQPDAEAGDGEAGAAGDGASGAIASHWDDHRFVRFRTTMALLERLLDAYTSPVPLARDYPARIAAGEHDPPYAFDSRTRTGAAAARAAAYTALGHPTDADSLDDRRIPRPPSVLRAVPPA